MVKQKVKPVEQRSREKPTKFCGGCKCDLPINRFYVKRTTTGPINDDGTYSRKPPPRPMRMHICMECSNNEVIRRSRKKWLARLTTVELQKERMVALDVIKAIEDEFTSRNDKDGDALPAAAE